MRNVVGLRSGRFLVLVATVALFVGPVRGHIQVLDPDGGEQLEVCSQFPIRWKILIFHNQLNWDLWYSTTSNVGPWTSIVQNLRPGNPAAGSTHTYSWTIPPDVDGSAWVQVRMDNVGTDYYDVSNAPFSIVPLPADINGDSTVNVLDLIDLLLCFGQPAVPGCEAEDVNGDGDVNVLDLIDLLLDFGESCP